MFRFLKEVLGAFRFIKNFEAQAEEETYQF